MIFHREATKEVFIPLNQHIIRLRLTESALVPYQRESHSIFGPVAFGPIPETGLDLYRVENSKVSLMRCGAANFFQPMRTREAALFFGGGGA